MLKLDDIQTAELTKKVVSLFIYHLSNEVRKTYTGAKPEEVPFSQSSVDTWGSKDGIIVIPETYGQYCGYNELRMSPTSGWAKVQDTIFSRPFLDYTTVNIDYGGTLSLHTVGRNFELKRTFSATSDQLDLYLAAYAEAITLMEVEF